MNKDSIRRKKLQQNIINMDNILSAEIIENPWPHAVIDNVFNLNLSNADANGSILIWMNNIHDIFYNNIENILNKYRSDRGGYNEKNKDKYYIDWGLQVQPSSGKSDIHIDDGRKLWSFVVYLFPKKSNGTGMYDKDKNLLQEVEWKQNRGFVFCSWGREISPTWHAYGNSFDEHRITLAVFICMDSVK